MRSSWTQGPKAAWGEVTYATKRSDGCYYAGREEGRRGALGQQSIWAELKVVCTHLSGAAVSA